MDTPPARASSASPSPATPPGTPPRGPGPPTPAFRPPFASLLGALAPDPTLGASRIRLPAGDAGGTAAHRAHARRPERGDPASASAFVPLPPVLGPPLGTPAPPPVGSAGDRATLAALADRVLCSLALGKVGRDTHEVRLLLRGPEGEAPLEVCLRQEGARLTAVLRSGRATAARADDLAERLRSELDRRGLAPDAIEVRVG